MNFQFSHQQLWMVAILVPLLPFFPFYSTSFLLIFLTSFIACDWKKENCLGELLRRVLLRSTWVTTGWTIFVLQRWGHFFSCCFAKFPQRSEQRMQNHQFSSFILERSSLHLVTCFWHVYLVKSFCSVWRGRDPDPQRSKTLTLSLANPC